MGKRQERISGTKIADFGSKIIKQECNIVLKDFSVIRGTANSIENDVVNLTDNLSHKHQFNFNEIEEIILEKVSAW